MKLEESHMKWEKPAYVERRLGFEINMYCYNR